LPRNLSPIVAVHSVAAYRIKRPNPGGRVLQPEVRAGVGGGGEGHDASDAAGETTLFKLWRAACTFLARGEVCEPFVVVRVRVSFNPPTLEP